MLPQWPRPHVSGLRPGTNRRNALEPRALEPSVAPGAGGGVCLRRSFGRRLGGWPLAVWLVLAGVLSDLAALEGGEPVGTGLRVGAAVVDVSPVQVPVLVNGGMTARRESEIRTRVKARCLVLDDGHERLAIAVVDSCMMPRQLLDEVKQLAATRTSLRPDRILISATHTHTAPSAMGALGTPADETYVPFLRQRLVEGLVAAEAKLTPARVGWGTGDAGEFTALRRWVKRPDRVELDPFGNATVRANMHAARQPDEAIGPSGPEDPELSMIRFDHLDGRPLAVLANFSMHYFGDSAISADYFGLFCDGMEQHMREVGEGEMVALLSHGCSGDIWRRDYMQPNPPEVTIDGYTQGLLQIATGIYDSIETTAGGELAMRETRLTLKYRTPDQQRLEWAQRIVQAMGDRLPMTQPEIYALEQIYLDEMQETEVVVQALRIGDIAIATTPNETYALTGLKLKLLGPLERTMVIELANGGDGYIPPPEQHVLGGYNTWAARSAGLEVHAEPKIAAAALRLLEEVSGQPRRAFTQSYGPEAERVLAGQPRHYWRLAEMSNCGAMDEVSGVANAEYEDGIVFFLEGPEAYTNSGEVNRCAHFAGGRLRTRLPRVGPVYEVGLSFWNGMPAHARGTTGWLFSRDYADGLTAGGLHLGVSGSDSERPGCLQLKLGLQEPILGSRPIERWSWHRVRMVVDEQTVQVFLDDRAEPEIVAKFGTSADLRPAIEQFYFGGRSDHRDNWEGRLDEISLR
jgi:hypothetical protein